MGTDSRTYKKWDYNIDVRQLKEDVVNKAKKDSYMRSIKIYNKAYEKFIISINKFASTRIH